MVEARTQICITIRFNLNNIFLNYSHIVLAIITAAQPEVKQPKTDYLNKCVCNNLGLNNKQTIGATWEALALLVMI